MKHISREEKLDTYPAGERVAPFPPPWSLTIRFQMCWPMWLLQMWKTQLCNCFSEQLYPNFPLFNKVKREKERWDTESGRAYCSEEKSWRLEELRPVSLCNPAWPQTQGVAASELNPWQFCLSLSRARITSMHHHVWLWKLWYNGVAGLLAFFLPIPGAKCVS